MFASALRWGHLKKHPSGVCVRRCVPNMSLIAGLRLLVASIRFALICAVSLFQGPFTSLRFSKKADRLVSGSDDGMIIIWRIKDWVCVSFKPAHKGSVTDLDVKRS